MVPVIGIAAGGHAKVVIEILRHLSDYELIGLLDSRSELHHTTVLGVPVLGDDNLLAGLATLGANVIINTGAIVEHDCVIGDHVHIATGAQLASTVRVGAGTHIGVGATIRQCISIGENVIVGAGAVVIRDVNANSVVAGVPARALRKRE